MSDEQENTQQTTDQQQSTQVTDGDNATAVQPVEVNPVPSAEPVTPEDDNQPADTETPVSVPVTEPDTKDEPSPEASVSEPLPNPIDGAIVLTNQIYDLLVNMIKYVSHGHGQEKPVISDDMKSAIKTLFEIE